MVRARQRGGPYMKLYTRGRDQGSRSGRLGTGVSADHWCGPAGARVGWSFAADAEGVPGPVPDSPAVTGESADRWRAVRRVLTAHRYELGRVAARLYPEVPRAASADLLCRAEWLPAAP